MGKGDKKTRRGKLFQNSYGVTRPRNPKSTATAPTLPKQETPIPPAEVKKPKPASDKKEVKNKKKETA